MDAGDVAAWVKRFINHPGHDRQIFPRDVMRRAEIIDVRRLVTSTTTVKFAAVDLKPALMSAIVITPKRSRKPGTYDEISLTHWQVVKNDVLSQAGLPVPAALTGGWTARVCFAMTDSEAGGLLLLRTWCTAVINADGKVLGDLIWERRPANSSGYPEVDSPQGQASERDMAWPQFAGLAYAIDFLNCVNVVLVEPERSRAATRRIIRTGLRITEINVRSIAESVNGANGPSSSTGVPLTSVRGHHAEYGPAYDKGLLFGKYEGRFWIPQHARGSADQGEVRHRYVIGAK